MVTSKHRCDDSRIWGLEAHSLISHGLSVSWIGPNWGTQPGDESIRYVLFPQTAGSLRRTTELFKALRRTPARVYQCHEPDALLATLPIALLRGSKVIFDAHEFFRGYLADKAPRGFKTIAGLAYFIFESISYRLCDHLITVSDGVAGEMAKAISPSKITVVANCSGPSVFILKPPALPPAELRILHLGTASFYHQLREMLEAFCIVRQAVPGAEFLQVGRVPDQELEWLHFFESSKGLNGAIRYIPRVPFEELGGYLKASDIGLIARRSDSNANAGFATKLFDYATFGLPIVATNLKMLRAFNDRYRSMTLVDTRKPDQIAAAILELHNNQELREMYRRNGIAAVEQEYSWEHMSRRLLSIYDRLLRRTVSAD